MTNTESSTKLFFGLSGVVLPIPKYRFPEEYQKTTRLTYYASFFNSIEVNSSFYALPQKRTVEKWSLSVPQNFKFTFKFPRDITHQKDLAYEKALIRDFFEVVSAVQSKKACVLIQFPPSCKASRFREVADLLDEIMRENEIWQWHVAVEFRDPSWYQEEVFDLLKALKVSLVLQDIPKSSSPFISTAEDFIYIRFHGPTGNYRGSYADEFLHEYSSYINDWLKENKSVYVYFNNTAGSAFENLQTLRHALYH